LSYLLHEIVKQNA